MKKEFEELTNLEKRLVMDYSTLILGEKLKIEDVKVDKLKEYIQLEIQKRIKLKVGVYK